MRLTKEEEIELFTRVAAGDRAARQEAVENYLWLIPVNIRRYHHRDQHDLEQEAVIGLYKAVDGFRLARGLRFSTYAAHWIRQAAMDYLYTKGTLVRIPTYMKKVMAKLRQGQVPTDVAPHVVERARALIETSTEAIEDWTEPESFDAPPDEVRVELQAALEKIPRRERVLIQAHFLDKKTYRELGETEGVSGERIRQIIQRGLRRLRENHKLGRIA